MLISIIFIQLALAYDQFDHHPRRAVVTEPRSLAAKKKSSPKSKSSSKSKKKEGWGF
jgi:hypothetical protein